MSEFRLLTQRVGLIGLVSLFTGLSGVIMLPILSKNMPLADFGVWAQVNVTIGLISVLMLIGLPDALTRFAAAAKNREELQEHFYTIFSLILASGMAVALLMLLFSDSLASALFDGKVAITKILPLILLLHSLNTFLLYYFRTVQQMKIYSIFTTLTTALDIVLVSGFVLAGQGIYGAVIALLMSRVALFLVMLILIISSIGIKKPEFKDYRSYLAFGIPLVPTFLSSWVINSSDRYVITLLQGTAAVGIYSPGYMLGNIVAMFIVPLGCVLPVALSKCHDNNQMDLVETMLARALKYYLAIAIPAVFGLSLLSKPILSVLSTQQIASQGYMITPFIAVSMLLLGVTSILVNIIALKKKTVFLGLIWVGAALLNLGLTLILVHYMGIVGAAVATLAAFVFVLVFTARYSSRYLSLNTDYIFLLKSVLSSLIMSIIIVVWAPTALLELLAVTSICSLVYFVALFLLGGIDKRELDFFKDAIFNRS
jgi:O-antigen/teichoic acid export membrane protein